MVVLNNKSSYEEFPPPEILGSQRYYGDYSKDLESRYSPPPTGRVSQDIADRDVKVPGWDARMEYDGTVPDGNSAIVLIDPEKRRPETQQGRSSPKQQSAVTKKWQPPEDPNIVTWDGPDDPEMATNWPLWRKYMTSLILSLYLFIAPFSANMVTPILDVIGRDINIPAGPQRTLILSVPLLTAGLGPLIWAPLVEKFGRKPLLRYTNAIFIIFNTACGFASTGAQLLVFRFLAAFGASSPGIIAPGLTAETYPPEIGGTGDTMHAMLPFIGKALAPIMGAFASQGSDWRWTFFGTSLFSLFALSTTFLLKETYPRVILEKKAARLRKETGNSNLRTEYHVPGMSEKTWMLKKAALPLIMLVSWPCVFVPFAYRGYLHGILALVLSIFENTFRDNYQMDTVTAALNYFSLMAGFVIGLQLSYKLINLSTYYLTRKFNKPHCPEFRVPPQGVAALLIPFALLLFGWSVAQRFHFIVPNIAAFFLAIGSILAFFSLQPYVTDSVGLEYASSAHSNAVLLAGLFEFSFTQFGGPLVASQGIGLSMTLLALGTIAVAVPTPFVLWFFGTKLRASKRGMPVPPVQYPLPKN